MRGFHSLGVWRRDRVINFRSSLMRMCEVCLRWDEYHVPYLLTEKAVRLYGDRRITKRTRRKKSFFVSTF